MPTVDWIVGEGFEIVEWRIDGDRLHVELLDGGVMWDPDQATPVVSLDLTGMAPSESIRADLTNLEAEGVWAIGQEAGDSGPTAVFEGEGWTLRVPCRRIAVERGEIAKRHFVRVVRELRRQLDSVHSDERTLRDRVLQTRSFLQRSLAGC